MAIFQDFAFQLLIGMLHQSVLFLSVCEPSALTVKSAVLQKNFSLAVKKKGLRDFPVCTVVKNQLANAGDRGLSPGLGRSHMPQSN